MHNTPVTVFRVSCFVCWLPVALHRAMGDHGKALATLNDRLQLGGLNMQQQVRGSPRSHCHVAPVTVACFHRPHCKWTWHMNCTSLLRSV